MVERDAIPKQPARPNAARARAARPDPALRPAPPAATLEDKLARIARRTFSKQVVAQTSSAHSPGFAFDAERFPDPILLTAMQCSGDKLRVAAALGQHTAPAADLVNACINEIAVQGATPLYFNLHFCAGEIDGDVAEAAATGAATACRSAGCALLATDIETSEAAAQRGKAYELSGHLTGVCSRTRLLTLDAAADGDVLLGLPATGLHSSGDELARHLLIDTAGHSYELYVSALQSKVGAALLQPHRSYLAPIRKLVLPGLARGFVHVAQNGLAPSLHRSLGPAVRAHIDGSTWEPPPLFAYLRSVGGFTEAEMLEHFNLGIGLVAVVPAPMLREAQMVLKRMNERSFVIGRLLAERRRPL